MPPIKPGRWSVNQAEVAPEWAWFWQYAGHAAVYNEGYAAPRDLVTGDLASTVTSIDWTPREHGIGPSRDTTTDRLIWAARDSFQLLADIDFSVGIVVYKTTNSGGLVVARDDTDNGMWEFLHASATTVSFDWRVAGGQQSVSWTVPSVSTDEIHTFFVARTVGGTFELWIDGVSQGTQTNATAPATSRAHNLEIGRRGNNTASVLGTYLASYVWQGLALADSFVQQLHTDPYGPFRRNPALTEETHYSRHPQPKGPRWNANQAEVAPEFQDLWRGLVACVPIWGNAGKLNVGERLSEVVKGTLSNNPNPGGTAEVLDTYGRGYGATRGNDNGVTWPGADDGAYDAVSRSGKGTIIAIVAMGTNADGGPDGIFGLNTGNGDGFNFYSGSTEDAKFRTASGVVTVGASLIGGAGPLIWVGRWDGATRVIELYRPDGTLWLSQSNAATISPDPSGRLTVGSFHDVAAGANASIFFGAIWDRKLGDAEIRKLVNDPYGLFRRYEPTEDQTTIVPTYTIWNKASSGQGDPDRNSYSFDVQAGHDPNRVLLVWVWGWDTDALDVGASTPTYDGVNMTLIGRLDVNGAVAREMSLWYLDDPAAGINTLAGGWDRTVERSAIIAQVFHGAESVNVAKYFTETGSASAVTLSVDAADAESLLYGFYVQLDNRAFTPGDEEIETVWLNIEPDNNRNSAWAGYIDPDDTAVHDFDGTWSGPDAYGIQAVEVTKAGEAAEIRVVGRSIHFDHPNRKVIVKSGV
jgi:hypothetical protein